MNLQDHWKAGVARLDPEIPPCTGFTKERWRAKHETLVQWVRSKHAEIAAKEGWPTIALFGVDRQRGASVPNIGFLMREGRVTEVTGMHLRHDGVLRTAGEVGSTNLVTVWADAPERRADPTPPAMPPTKVTAVVPLQGDLELGGTLTATSWVPPEGMDEDRWKDVGESLGKAHRSMTWWLGDWWLFGERKVGERKFGDGKALIESEDWGGPCYQTVLNAATTCRRFDSSRRKYQLTFTHHAMVSGQPEKDQDELLDWCLETIPAEGKPRSTYQLRQEMERRKHPNGVPTVAAPAAAVQPEAKPEAKPERKAPEPKRTSEPSSTTSAEPTSSAAPQPEPISSLADPAVYVFGDEGDPVRPVIVRALPPDLKSALLAFIGARVDVPEGEGIEILASALAVPIANAA